MCILYPNLGLCGMSKILYETFRVNNQPSVAKILENNQSEVLLLNKPCSQKPDREKIEYVLWIDTTNRYDAGVSHTFNWG